MVTAISSHWDGFPYVALNLLPAENDRIKADSHIACRAHAVPLPCHAAKGLECVFPIRFKQWGRV